MRRDDEGAAVDDAEFHRLGVAEILNPYPGVERERAVSRRHFLHVVDFAIRGRTAMVGVAVPTGDAGLGVAGRHRARRGRADVPLMAAARQGQG